jgi:hypothetical protein
LLRRGEYPPLDFHRGAANGDGSDGRGVVVMLFGILNFRRKVGKVNFQKDRHRLWSMYLKPEMAEAIRTLKRWKKRGFATRLAEQTGYTRQMMAAVLKQRESCGIEVAMAIAEVAGLRPNSGECWCYLFDCRLREIDPNSPKLNKKKFDGEIPYDSLSVAAEFRKLDNPDVEKKC